MKIIEGWGILALIIWPIIFMFVVPSFTTDESASLFEYLLGFFIASLGTWYVGKKLDDKDGYVYQSPRTGDKLRLGSRHIFVFVPLKYWGLVYLALAALVFLFD